MAIHSYIISKTDKMKYFTDMKVVFDSLGNRQNEYNWLISDFELNHYTDDSWCDEPYIWISGDQLSELVYQNDIQFIWGVFSGFKKNITVDFSDRTFIPYAEGNSRLWIKEPKIQHPKADIEIVCWDSSLCLFLTRDENLANQFKSYFIEAEDLREFNRK
jgi:hypothetical protein